MQVRSVFRDAEIGDSGRDVASFGRGAGILETVRGRPRILAGLTPQSTPCPPHGHSTDRVAGTPYSTPIPLMLITMGSEMRKAMKTTAVRRI